MRKRRKAGDTTATTTRQEPRLSEQPEADSKSIPSKIKNTGKKTSKLKDEHDEERKSSKCIAASRPKTQKTTDRKCDNIVEENLMDKKHKEDSVKRSSQEDSKSEEEENKKISVTKSKVKSGLLKRSLRQESFEDMLLGMDEKLKEFCAKKQKTKVRKPKEGEKTNTFSKTQDMDSGGASEEAAKLETEDSSVQAEGKRPEEYVEDASEAPDTRWDLMHGGDGEMTDEGAESKTPEEEECSVSDEGITLEKLETEDSSTQAESKRSEEGVEDGSVALSDGQGVKIAKKTRKKRVCKDNSSKPSETNLKKIQVGQVESVKNEQSEISQQEFNLKGKRRNPQSERNTLAVKKRKMDKEEPQQKSQAQKEEEMMEEIKWKWWEEAHYEDGVKWRFLEHKGPLFAPEYEPLTDDVHFYYNGRQVKLSANAEEVATFFGKMLDHDYTTNNIFQKNFFADWREVMTNGERKLITDLGRCDFHEIHRYFTEQAETKRAQPKQVKQELKMEQEAIGRWYGYCTMDGHRERIANYKIEPPGLFRGRGSHPKMGKLKKRTQPEDVIINCSRDSKIPVPPAGHSWKEVRFDNKVTWLASWTENIQGTIKYIMLNPSSKLRGEKDWQKFEIARRLKGCVDHIRTQYSTDLKSREMKSRQRAVALYFIDKLALRAGNEKEEGETADTVGCCSLRVEHINLHEMLDDQMCVVEFDFLGKDSIRYYNKVPVKKQVFKNLKHFMDNKDPGDNLFDRLNTHNLNRHLQELMEGLTAKVFRTYNASITLQEQLQQLTSPEGNEAEKLLSYNRANRAVAVLCNHQRAPPKSFDQSMKNIQAKIKAKREQIDLIRSELKSTEVDQKAKKDVKSKQVVEKKRKMMHKLEEQLSKLKVQATDREENKQIALGTSKLNYLDPRITVAWCKKFDVPIEKVYNKTQREKFAWAIDMTEQDFVF